ncbi:MAG: M36 family metallopeptidase [Phycisphaerales bacterium]|nr:M36 family metallopeptidase [Phycisphaerales bacterium]
MHFNIHPALIAGVAGVCVSVSLAGAADLGAAGTMRATASHPAWCVQCNHGEGLPAFDVRIDDAVIRAWATTLAEAAAAKAGGAAVRLRAAVPMTSVDYDESLGTPVFVRSTAGNLTGQHPGATWRAVLGEFVTANRALMGFDASEVNVNRVTRDFVMARNGVRHVTVQQTHAGVDIFDATVRASFTARGELVNVSSRLLDRPAGGFAPGKAVVTARQAVALAAADAGVTVDAGALEVVDRGDGPDGRTVFKAPAALRADEPVEARLVYFPVTRDTLAPAWAVVVPQHGVGHTYDTLIDATDGKVLYRTDRLVCAAPATFRVFTGDSPAPMSPGLSTVSSFQAALVDREPVTVADADVAAWSRQGWFTAGQTQTVGNNVDAQTDIDGNNASDIGGRADGGAAMLFDFAMDLAQGPSAYRPASVTQGFYWANRFHDRLYELGFTEPAGNFQSSNFGLGGTGGDAVQLDVQDGSGTDNANFSTSGNDGSGGRCQMFVWTGPNPDRDGVLESDILFHELTHGVSIRLHGSLSQTQSAGMGEGWSDFFSLSLNSQAGDDPDAVYTVGPYATYQLGGMNTNYYFGIRRFPYSTDMSKGPLTYGDIDAARYNVAGSIPRSPAFPTGNSDVHDYGEVWCQILWECRAAMVRAYGYEGNQAMLRLVIDGMALSPSNPTFIQARDSILQAEINGNGGVNLGRLWAAFARRGMGVNASGPAASTTSGVNENTTVPALTTFTFPDGQPTQLSPTAPTAFRVDASPLGLTLTPDSGTVSYRVNGGAYTSAPMTYLGASLAGVEQYSAAIPALPCFASVDYYVSIGSSAGAQSSPAGAPVATVAAQVFSSTATLASDGFENDAGWTVGPDTATAGNWVRGNPVGTSAQPEDDHTPGAGVSCWFTGQGTVGSGNIGEADVDGGATLLTSPAYDLSSVPDATVSYWRWYSNGLGATAFTDTFRVYVSVNNGSSWTLAETVGPASSPDTQPGWRFASWTFSSLGLTPSAQTRVRFIAEDAGSGSLVEAAVDDFSIVARLCQSGPTPCGPADLGGQGGVAGADGLLDNNDFVVFIREFFANGAGADAGRQGGVPGGDGQFDNNDFIVFISMFFSGCP